MPPVTFRNPFDRTSQPPRIVVAIPARFQSTRFPGKPLVDLAGRPMIEHVYHRAASAHGVDAVIVATDDERIVWAVERFGGISRMTSATHRTGTDRIAEAVAELPCEIVVNVQGDEPLIEAAMIEQVIAPLEADETASMSTLCRRITEAGDYTNPNVVKVVADRDGNALYFSRAPIPFIRGHDPAPDFALRASSGKEAGHYDPSTKGASAAYKHIGIYAYRRPFLLEFAHLPQTPLEILESLEQLRALQHGVRIRVVETQYDSIGVDTPEDLERVRVLLTTGARV